MRETRWCWSKGYSAAINSRGRLGTLCRRSWLVTSSVVLVQGIFGGDQFPRPVGHFVSAFVASHVLGGQRTQPGGVVRRRTRRPPPVPALARLHRRRRRQRTQPGGVVRRRTRRPPPVPALARLHRRRRRQRVATIMGFLAAKFGRRKPISPGGRRASARRLAGRHDHGVLSRQVRPEETDKPGRPACLGEAAGRSVPDSQVWQPRASRRNFNAGHHEVGGIEGAHDGAGQSGLATESITPKLQRRPS